MKKIYLLLATAIVTSSGFSQSRGGKAKIQNSINTIKHSFNSKAATDTTGLVKSNKWIPEEYAKSGISSNWTTTNNNGYAGYIYGVNTNNYNHCAQGYKNVNSTPIGVEGVLIAAAYKKIGNGGSGNASATINLYNMAPNSAKSWDGSAWVQNALGPNGNAIGTTTLAFSNIDTSSQSLKLTYAPFSNVISVNGDFAVSFDMTAIGTANDTVSLWSDAHGEGSGLAFYINQFLGSFVTRDLYDQQTPDNNVAIFAVIDDGFVGIESIDFYNDMQMSAYPNPSINNTTIAYNLNENKKRVNLTIFDMSGKEVYSQAFGSQTKGSYKVNLDVTNFNAGNYFYSLISDGNRLTKKLVIVK